MERFDVSSMARKKPMTKILFIVNVDWFFISHRLPLALEAQQRGYDVYIACGITDKKAYLESLGLKVYPLELSRSGMGIKSELKAFSDIYKALRQINPDIAHFVTIKPVLYGGIASRFLSIPKKVFSISGLGFIFIRQGFKASILKLIVKVLYGFALGGKNSHVIVQNPDDANVIMSITKAPIATIKGSGVDLAQYTYIQENNEKTTIVMACRLLKDKGVLEYIEAAKTLKNKGLDAAFELYGDADIYNPATLTNQDIQKIQKENFISIHEFSDNIATIFSNANIIVLPSYREGLPKVLIEAAACGRATVTTNVPGCRDAIEDNITGLLCCVKDAQSLAEQIEKLILDTDLRKSMGKAGRELAEREFDIVKIIRQHFEIYEAGK